MVKFKKCIPISDDGMRKLENYNYRLIYNDRMIRNPSISSVHPENSTY